MSSPAEGSAPAGRARPFQRPDAVIEELEATLDRTVALARQLFEQRTGLSWEDVVEPDPPH